MTQIYYVMDPMCSWCWAFSSVLDTIANRLVEEVPLRYIMGGLAADSHDPMPESMQHYLQQTWHTIAERTGTEFNFDFWQTCQPRRSTYPACRAVIAAGSQAEHQKVTMVQAIQRAYYLQARNPSDSTTLIEIADEIGLDQERFAIDLRSDGVKQQFREDLQRSHQFGVQGFPSMIVEQHEQLYWVTRGYTPAEAVLERLATLNLLRH